MNEIICVLPSNTLCEPDNTSVARTLAYHKHDVVMFYNKNGDIQAKLLLQLKQKYLLQLKIFSMV